MTAYTVIARPPGNFSRYLQGLQVIPRQVMTYRWLPEKTDVLTVLIAAVVSDYLLFISVPKANSRCLANGMKNNTVCL